MNVENSVAKGYWTEVLYVFLFLVFADVTASVMGITGAVSTTTYGRILESLTSPVTYIFALVGAMLLAAVDTVFRGRPSRVAGAAELAKKEKGRESGESR